MTLTEKIEFVKILKEKLLGKYLSVEILSVVEYMIDFGVVENIDVAEEKVSVWSGDGEMLLINLNDIVKVDFNPLDKDLCLKLEALNEVKVEFSVE